MKNATHKSRGWIVLVAGVICLCVVTLALGGYLLMTRWNARGTAPVRRRRAAPG